MQSVFACLLSLTLAAVTLCQAQNVLTKQEAAAGWELLFDGKTTKGWRSPSVDEFPHECWRVEDGFLTAPGGGKRLSDLRTAGTYRNFELSFEWKISQGGNSGVKYLIGDFLKGAIDQGKILAANAQPGPNSVFVEWARGFEYQIIDDEQHPDKDNPKTRTGSLYEIVAASEAKPRLAGELNQSRIVIKGTRIEHWLNGVQVLAADLDAKEFREALASAPLRSQRAIQYLNQDCPVALQSHGEAVWFRNIKLRRL